jgi:hypothetical protein
VLIASVERRHGMPRQEQRPEDADDVFDRQRAIYEESYQQRGLSEEEAQHEADEKLKPAERRPGRDEG